MLRQNIVFVENRAGSLREVTRILTEENLNVYGFACFDAPEYALFRMVCSDPDKAEKLLTEKGYMNRVTPVIAVNMEDRVGGLDGLLKIMSESNVNLNYIYTTFHRQNFAPVIILYSEDLFVTESILRGNGYQVLETAEELQS